MSLTELGAIGEFVGAVAVVVSLLFLAVQLRSNTHALRATSYQAIHDSEDRFYSDVSNDADLARIWKQGAHGIDEVPPEDRPRWEMLGQRYVFLIQTVHYQRRKGMIDDEFWTAWDQGWIEMIATHVGIQEIYARNQSVYTPKFREYTEACRSRFRDGRAALLVGERQG